MGVTPLEFCLDFGHKKTRVPGLLHGVVCVILGLAVFVELRLVTERQTNGRTDRWTNDDSIYHTSIASRGKNQLEMRDRA